MPTLIESFEHNAMPYRAREQGARLLEGLRAAYQSLSPEMRHQVKGLIAGMAGLQYGAEMNKES